MSEIAIRNAAESDLPAITTLWFEMMNYHLARDRRFAISYDASTVFTAWIRGLMQNPDVACIAVAEEKDSVQGYILGQIEELPPVYTIHKVGIIRDVCVVQGARHAGVGTQLFQHSLAWFKASGAGSVQVRIPVENQVAHKFWENQGFTPITTILRMELA
jgi:GNAT superfamily N-acetyltransferase